MSTRGLFGGCKPEKQTFLAAASALKVLRATVSARASFTFGADEAELAESVHEEADAGSRRSNHFGQCFLADVRSDRLRAPLLPEWKKHAADLESEMLGRGMLFEIIDWAEGQGSLLL